MKGWYKKFLILVMACIPVIASAQDIDARSPKSQGPVTNQQRKADKKKAKLKVKQEEGERLAQKRSEKLQTKAVQKRMKKSKKKAGKWHDNKK